MDKKRIAWCITGSGHYLKESIDLMLTLENVDLYLSKAGEEVLKWYDYDLEIIDIIKKKNTISVHYRWEGSREENGEIYTFSAIEFYYINKKKDLIERIVGLWSEKQFKDQFK